MTFHAAAASLGLAVLVGCAPQTQFVATNAPPRALTPRDLSQVAVFTTTAPDRPYAEVGMVSARVTTDPPQSKATLIEAVRAEAAKRGCDGIIYAAGSAAIAEATCIVYK